MSDETPSTDPTEQSGATETASGASQASATEATEQEPTVSSQVEETGPCARLLKVQIPPEIVQEEIDKSYEELRKTVFIKGFRKGRVPRHVLERRFSEEVLLSVKQSLVEEKFEEAVREHDLRLVSRPEIDLDAIELQPGQPLAFEVSLEVFPEFTIDNYTGLEVERPDTTVTDEDVDRALESLRVRHGEYRKIEEGVVEGRDVPVCHAIALKDDEEVWRRDELGVDLAAETIGGLRVEGLRDALMGAGLGETHTFDDVTLPDDFADESLRGQKVKLQVTIDEIRRFTMPEATDEWAQSLQFDDLDDLRDELRDQLRLERQRQADDLLRQRIEDRLLELTDFDVPEGLVERLVAQARERQRLALLYRGVPEDKIDEELQRLAQGTRDQSVRSCKLFFIIEKIADQEKIFVTEDELDQRIQAIALNYRRRPAEVRAELEETGRLDSLRRQMREEKVIDFLIQKAHILEPAQSQPAQDTQPQAPAADAPEPGDETP